MSTVFGSDEEDVKSLRDRSRQIKINLWEVGAKLLDQALHAFKDQVVYNLRDTSHRIIINLLEAKLRDQAFHAFKDQVYYVKLHSGTSDIEMLLQRNRKFWGPILEIHLPSQIKQQERSLEETELHSATREGDVESILQILHRNVDLITHEDSKGDLPLHEAARVGQLNAVITLTLFMTEFVKPKLSIGTANKEGNTALHLAVQNGHEMVAWFLLKEEPDTTYSLNNEGISPLYLAIEARLPDLVQHMDVRIPSRKYLDQIPPNKSLVHAAIRARDRGILAKVLKKYILRFNPFDEEGRTPLSYAAYIGYLDGVVLILDKFPVSAFNSDKDGSYPIHTAYARGHVEIIKQFVQCCPKTLYLLDGQGQNILQVASKSGSTKMVSYLQQFKEFRS